MLQELASLVGATTCARDHRKGPRLITFLFAPLSPAVFVVPGGSSQSRAWRHVTLLKAVLAPPLFRAFFFSAVRSRASSSKHGTTSRTRVAGPCTGALLRFCGGNKLGNKLPHPHLSYTHVCALCSEIALG